MLFNRLKNRVSKLILLIVILSLVSVYVTASPGDYCNIDNDCNAREFCDNSGPQDLFICLEFDNVPEHFPYGNSEGGFCEYNNDCATYHR